MDVLLVHRPDGHGGKTCIFDPAVELGSCADYPYGYVLPKAPLNEQSGYNPGENLLKYKVTGGPSGIQLQPSHPHDEQDFLMATTWPGFVKPCLFLNHLINYLVIYLFTHLFI